MIWAQLFLIAVGMIGLTLAEDFRDELARPQQDPQLHNRRYESSPRLSIVLTDVEQQNLQGELAGDRDGAKRFLLNDLSNDGYVSDRDGERWKLIKLNRILESLSSAIPTAASATLRRTGRTYPSSTSTGVSIMEVPRLSSGKPMIMQGRTLRTMTKSELEQKLNKNLNANKPAFMGIVWQPTGGSDASIETRSKSSLPGEQEKASTSGDAARSEEVSLSSPMQNRASSDYEFKRVENSRWNNLRGMWGKRSVPSDMGAYDD